MNEKLSLKEAAQLLGVSPATVRYRALKKGIYEYEEEHNPTGQDRYVIPVDSLLKQHPELEEKLAVVTSSPDGMELASMAPPEEGLTTTSVELRTSAGGIATSTVGRAEVVDTGRIRFLVDELEKVRKREREIRRELRQLMEKLVG
jgi:hypothetical protein